MYGIQSRQGDRKRKRDKTTQVSLQIPVFPVAGTGIIEADSITWQDHIQLLHSLVTEVLMKSAKPNKPKAAKKKGDSSVATLPNPFAKNPNMAIRNLLLDGKKPPQSRAKLLLDVLFNNNDPNLQQSVLVDLFQKFQNKSPETEVLQMKEHYNQVLSEFDQGPVRPATYIKETKEYLPTPTPRVLVVTPDGQQRFPTLHPRVKLENLEPGNTVYLDNRGSMVLEATDELPGAGQEGTFLRYLPEKKLVEATLQNDRLLLFASREVLEAAQEGKLRSGDKIIACPRRQFAFSVVPTDTDFRHRFLDNSNVPEIIAERDIGNPHWILDYMLRRLQVLLFRPDLLERFDLRPRFSVLLTGPSGCGKTLTIRAVLHAFNRMLVERTGRKDLGTRVIRVKVSELLSEWLGRSDKNIDDLFSDVAAIASTKVETEKGEELLLPVV